MDRAAAEARYPTAFAGIRVCRRLLDLLPDQPLVVDDWGGEFHAPSYHPGRPHLRLSPNRSAIPVHPWGGITDWVDYPPFATDPVGAIESDTYLAELRTVVERKLAELGAVAR
jgi:hypothetical protein